MKLPLLTAGLLLVLAGNATAQTGTGIVDINGGFGRTTYKSNTANSMAGHPDLSLVNWSLSTRVGRNFDKHFTAGLVLGYGIQHDLYAMNMLSSDVYDYKIKTWSVGAFGRYTNWVSKNIFIYSQFSLVKSGSEISSTVLQGYYNVPVTNGNPPNIDGNELNIDLSPVFGFNIYKGYGIHLGIGGFSYAIINTPSNWITDFNVSLGQRFTIGFQKIVGWKKDAKLKAVETTSQGK